MSFPDAWDKKSTTSADPFNKLFGEEVEPVEVENPEKLLVEQTVRLILPSLRQNFLKEIKRFVRTSPEVVQPLVASPNPTDPLFLETSTDEAVEFSLRERLKAPEYAAQASVERDRPRWDSMFSFIAVAATAAIGPCK